MTDSIIVSSTELSVNINPPAVQTISATNTSLELVINQQPLVSVDVIKSLDNSLSVLRGFSSSSDIPDLAEAVDDRVSSLLVASNGINLDYNDTANTLTIAATGFALVAHSHVSSDVTDFSEGVDERVNSLLVASTGIHLDYDDTANTLTIAATGFALVAHSHVSSDVTDFSEGVDERVNSLLVASTGIHLDYDDTANTLTIATTGVLLNTILPITYNNLSNSATNSLNVQKRTAKAWINFNGTGTISIRDSFNISSIVDNGIGMYTINFATAMPDTNYCVVAMGRYFSNDIYSQNLATLNQSSIKTVGSVAIVSNYSRGGNKYDCSELNIIIFAS